MSHAQTTALRTAAFPRDEPLDASGARRAATAAGSVRTDQVSWCGPEVGTRHSAGLLGLTATRTPRWRDLDDIPEPELLAWLTDPSAAPHGGESVGDLISRTRDWMHDRARTPGRTVAVTHPAVVRAALVGALDNPPGHVLADRRAPADHHQAAPAIGIVVATPRLPAAYPRTLC